MKFVLLSLLLNAVPVSGVPVMDFFDRTDTSYAVSGPAIGSPWVNSNNSDEWCISEGQLLLNVKSPSAVLYYNTELADQFTVCANVSANTSNGWAGIVFNYQDSDNYYALRIKGGASSCQMLCIANGSLYQVMTSMTAANDFVVGEMYILEVSSNNSDQFSYKINSDIGTSMAAGTVSYSRFSNGYAGVYSPTASTITPDAKFDNFYIDDEPEFTARGDRLRDALFGFNLGIENVVVPGTNTSVFGADAGSALRLGLDMWADECNDVLLTFCNGLSTGITEVDFTAMELARVYVDLNGSTLLEDDTATAITNFFATCNIEDMQDLLSENHYLTFLVARYLMAQEMMDVPFSAYGGLAGAQFVEEDGERLKKFIRYRARRGWGEFDSGAYQYLSMNLLLSLFDHTNDPELKHLTGMMLNLMLADMAVDDIKGLYSGARGRVYAPMVYDAAGEHGDPPMCDMNEMKYLYFGITDPEYQSVERLLRLQPLNKWDRSNESLFSSFRPMPIIRDIMLGRTNSYVNRERKHLHDMYDPVPDHVDPEPGSIRKYTWYTPEYAVGSIQLQDDYTNAAARVYAKHQQHDWDFTVPIGTATRIFTHHPGTSSQHDYWAGDFGCRCSQTFQHETSVLSVFNIRVGEEHQYIHAYFPTNKFDEVVTSSTNGWVFARKANVMAALWMYGPLSWNNVDNVVELVSDGTVNASVFEAATTNENCTFEDFVNHFSSTKVWFSTNTLTLTYRNLNNELVNLLNGEMRQISYDGSVSSYVDVDMDYPTYDSPYMQSVWDSGVVALTYGASNVIFDFSSDNFNRANTAYSTDGLSIGEDWASSNDSNLWKISDSNLCLNVISGPAVLYNERVVLGDSFTVSADVTVQADGNLWSGIVFNYQDATHYYGLRFKTGTTDYQLIRANGTVGAPVSATNAVESFAVGTTYTLTVTSGADYNFDFTITKKDSPSTILNPTRSGLDGNSLYTGGFAGVYAAGGLGGEPDFAYDNFRFSPPD